MSKGIKKALEQIKTKLLKELKVNRGLEFNDIVHLDAFSTTVAQGITLALTELENERKVIYKRNRYFKTPKKRKK